MAQHCPAIGSSTAILHTSSTNCLASFARPRLSTEHRESVRPHWRSPWPSFPTGPWWLQLQAQPQRSNSTLPMSSCWLLCSPGPGSRLSLRLSELRVIEGSNPLHGLACSHVGFELPRDVVVHGLAALPASPLEVGGQKVRDLVYSGLPERSPEMIHQVGHASPVGDPSGRLTRHQALCSSCELLDQARPRCVSLFPRGTAPTTAPPLRTEQMFLLLLPRWESHLSCGPPRLSRPRCIVLQCYPHTGAEVPLDHTTSPRRKPLGSAMDESEANPGHRSLWLGTSGATLTLS